MERKDLIAALGRLKVETGSLACLGCGYEHDCGVHGCAILRAAMVCIADLETTHRTEICEDGYDCTELGKVRKALQEAESKLGKAERERDAAVRDLEEIMFRGRLNIDTCEPLTLEQLREVPHGKIKDTTLESICDRVNEVTSQSFCIDRNQWISVKDRTPEDEKAVLAYYGFYHEDDDLGARFIGTLTYFSHDSEPHWQHESTGIFVTHWMPLPEPPEEVCGHET